MRTLIYLFLFSFTIHLTAQTSSDFKISNIKVVPFNGKTGELEGALKSENIEPYNNAISTSLFVIVEVSGKAGFFEAKKKVEIEVMEGKKVKLKKIEKNLLFGDNGKLFIPVLLDPLICSNLRITAKILGQANDSKREKTIPFSCGQ